MVQKNNSSSTHPIYYVSPVGKIHAHTCRHCQPDKEGWRKLDSFLTGITEGYQPCRLCCPSEAEIKLLQEKSTSVDTENVVIDTPQEEKSPEKVEDKSFTEETQPTVVKKDKKNEATAVKGDKSEKVKNSSPTKGKQEKFESKKEKVEKKRYKILAGNGCHQAIAEIQGILVPPSEEDQPFLIILPDGVQLEATFKNPRLKWIAHNTDTVLGSHWFRVYPKMKDDKLISVQIIAWDKGMPTNPMGEEHWEFTGVWTAQKNLTVQRSMMEADVRATAKETGFIKKFKYTFINSFEFVKKKNLWMGYVYKLICKRKGDVLEIRKVIPYACPRIKPEPKNFRKDNDRDGKFNKDGKKDFKPKTFVKKK
ncbi:hypothetical protein ACN4EE_13915 [Geminocystis sp. CENA526]|uniref:hypothetical protein n=1 Tax=Geminocystis sp. CENA526 TaxID=1355871 RepID=UPI003D6E79C5